MVSSTTKQGESAVAIIQSLLDIIHDDLTHARQADHADAICQAKALVGDRRCSLCAGSGLLSDNDGCQNCEGTGQSQDYVELSDGPEWRLRVGESGFYVMVHRDDLTEWDRQEIRDSTEYLRRDGNMWMAHDKEFVNLAESDAAFSETPTGAIVGLRWLRKLREIQKKLAAWTAAKAAVDAIEYLGDRRITESVEHYTNELSNHIATRPDSVPETLMAAIARATNPT